MRTYLVVIDESPEAALAIRFAARRAAKTGGGVHVVTVTEPQEFVAWGGVQATIEAEAQERAEQLVNAAAGALVAESGIRPSVTVREGRAADIVRNIIAEERGRLFDPDIADAFLTNCCEFEAIALHFGIEK